MNLVDISEKSFANQWVQPITQQKKSLSLSHMLKSGVAIFCLDTFFLSLCGTFGMLWWCLLLEKTWLHNSLIGMAKGWNAVSAVVWLMSLCGYFPATVHLSSTGQLPKKSIISTNNQLHNLVSCHLWRIRFSFLGDPCYPMCALRLQVVILSDLSDIMTKWDPDT